MAIGSNRGGGMTTPIRLPRPWFESNDHAIAHAGEATSLMHLMPIGDTVDVAVAPTFTPGRGDGNRADWRRGKHHPIPIASPGGAGSTAAGHTDIPGDVVGIAGEATSLGHTVPTEDVVDVAVAPTGCEMILDNIL